MFILCSSTSLFAQGTDESFGQNRVQYKEFNFNYFESDNFLIYSYVGGQELAQFTVQTAEEELESLQKSLDFKFRRQVDVVVFNDLSDLNQSNIGIYQEATSTYGRTKVVGNKIFLHFTGDHREMRQQIREGLANILIAAMMYGGNVQEILQNAVLLNLPDWFLQGLISYIGEEWSPELDNKLKDAILSGRFENHNRLTGEDAKLFGHAMWHYVGDQYGQQSVPNLLYLTRINKSVENGFLYVLGSSVDQTVEEFNAFYKKRFTDEVAGRNFNEKDRIIPKLKGGTSVDHVKVSPDGKYLAYVSFELASFKVHLYDIAKGSSKVIHKGGFKTYMLVNDYSYPLVAFSPKSRKLGVIYEHKDVVRMIDYNISEKKKEKKDLKAFKKILSFNYADNEREIVLAANRRGQSDVYVYKLSSGRKIQITNDFYDDLQPDFVSINGKRGVVFASNRTTDSLKRMKLDTEMPLGNFDIFYYDIERKPKVLARVTNTPGIDETYPSAGDSKHLTYLSDASGINNRYAAYLDSSFAGYDFKVFFKDSTVWNPASLDSLIDAESDLIDSVQTFPAYAYFGVGFPISNYPSGVLRQDIAERAEKSLSVVVENGKKVFYLSSLPNIRPPGMGKLKPSFYRVESAAQLSEAPSKSSSSKKDSKDGLDFQNEFEEDSAPTPATKKTATEASASDKPLFSKSRQVPYRKKFTIEQVSTTLDNSIFINRYQSYGANGGVYESPELGGLITYRASDILEDVTLEGGFRVPTSFSGSEYFLSYEDRRKRLDKKLLYYRKVKTNPYSFQPQWFQEVFGKKKTNYFQGSMKYAFDLTKSLSAGLGYRDDKIYFQATDTFSLRLPNFKEHWLNLEVEFIHDNSYKLERNIPIGTRYKVWYELHKQFDLSSGSAEGTQFSFDPGWLHVIGFDFRNYQRLHKNLIWANRFAGGTSFGGRKLLYFLGGVDNWLPAEFNTEIEVDPEENYAFQTLATNMRGFPQNIRNGNNFAVINSEIRWPIFTYFINQPISSELIKNFQLVAFGDIGSAWNGSSPFDSENPYNTRIIEQDPLKVTVRHFRNPIVGSYGAGLRTVLFGYFLRLDLGWGIDTGEVQEKRWQFSLGMDF